MRINMFGNTVQLFYLFLQPYSLSWILPLKEQHEIQGIHVFPNVAVR